MLRPIHGILLSSLVLLAELTAGPRPMTADALTESAEPGLSRYVELRAYTTRPGLQGRFLEFFEEHYLESQEVVGMRVWGQFRDLDNPARFVWLRGYRSMEERRQGLERFYGSLMWKETRPEVVAMLAEPARHVHFLEPASSEEGFRDDHQRPPLASEVPADAPRGIVVAEVFEAGDDPDAVVTTVRDAVLPVVLRAGGRFLGLYRSSSEPNNFPPLSFIEDESVVVLLVSYPSRAEDEAAQHALSGSPPRLERFVLEPGPRSRMRHRSDESAAGGAPPSEPDPASR